MNRRILVAGIGNIFFGDDAFGVEVIRELRRHSLPESVKIEDFGIRGYDLAYAILSGCEAVILVDAAPRGEAPGTLFLIELNPDGSTGGEGEILDAHSMNPMHVLRMVQALGGYSGRLYLVGCEPEVLETEDLGLSASVQAAVPAAVEGILSLVGELLSEESAASASAAPI